MEILTEAQLTERITALASRWSPQPPPRGASRDVSAAPQERSVKPPGHPPQKASAATPQTTLVALDGRSGSGKSTLAARLAAHTGAVLIEGDDFYAGGTAAQWDAWTPAERAAHCIDWRRQRPVLEALLAGRAATWHPYDWDAHDGSLTEEAVTCEPHPVVILEGVYSARPELADLFALRVLLAAPEDLRRERLLQREGDDYDAAWDARWSSAEAAYFAAMPPEAFDVVVRPFG